MFYRDFLRGLEEGKRGLHRKHRLARLCLNKRGEYRERDGTVIRDLRFVANNGQELNIKVNKRSKL